MQNVMRLMAEMEGDKWSVWMNRPSEKKAMKYKKLFAEGIRGIKNTFIQSKGKRDIECNNERNDVKQEQVSRERVWYSMNIINVKEMNNIKEHHIIC